MPTELTDVRTVSAGVFLAYDNIDDAFGDGNEYLTFGVPIAMSGIPATTD